MKIFFPFTLLLLLMSFRVWAQSGCTDPLAQNYNPEATQNDGSCTYASTSVTLSNRITLPTTLNENSGLIFTDGNLWTLNDSGSGARIYRISETDGTILQTVTVTNATNTDWEAIAADTQFLYIGDFGNNANGNRTNLRVYRIAKANLGAEAVLSVTAEVINFRYEDQVVAGATGNNSTDYDCEAFLVKDETAHLFTKEWVSGKTRHYTFPATPGTHVAKIAETFDVKGLITGASMSAYGNVIVLIGYTTNLQNLFMWLLFDYKDDLYFSGNKRRFSLGSALQGQIEGVTFTSNGNGYISSERISSFISVSPSLYTFSVTKYVPEPIDVAPFPVELAHFDVVYKAPHVTLTWKTASEQNSDFFSVERSSDGSNFKEIGQLKAAGSSGIMLTYHFTDKYPAAGDNYYRLKQTDLDGTTSYSTVMHIAAPQAGGLQVRPVPATKGQLLQLELPVQDGAATVITLTGTDGKSHFYKEVAGTTALNEQLQVDHLNRGLYIVRVTNAQNSYAAKVVLQ